MSVRECARCLSSKTRVVALLSLALLVMIIIFPSCSSPQASGQTSGIATSTAIDTSSEVVLLDVIIRKIDPSSGVQLSLLPKNKSAVLVYAEGSVDVTLWYQQPIDTDGIVKRGELIQEWKGIPATRAIYEAVLGASITMEYVDANKNLGGKNVYGFLDVTLTLPDKTVLVTEETFVKISGNYSC